MQTSIAPAVVRSNEKKIIAAFQAASAITLTAATTLVSVGVHDGPVFHKLRRMGIVREVAPGLYFLDEARWATVRKWRRVVLTAAVVVVAVAFVFKWHL